MGSDQIIVVGAGPGGLTLAVALQLAGFDPVVHERAPSQREVGTAFTLWPNAVRALDLLGLGPELRRRCKQLEGIAMTTSDGSELFRVDSSVWKANFGTVWALRRSELIELLLQRLDSRAVRFGAACVNFEQTSTGVEALFEDGSVATGSALIGADGLHSTVRSLMFGQRELRFAGYEVWRGISKLRLPMSVGVTSLGRGRQFGFFPMSADSVYWFASRNAREAEPDSLPTTKAELLEGFAHWHAPVPKIIKNTAESSILRNGIYDIDPLEAWTCGRATLLGDAAHPAAPDLGQGACQAIEDAVVLARSLQRGADVFIALKDYQSARIRRTRNLTLLARRIGQAGTWTNPVMCTLRNWMIRLTPEWVRLQHLQRLFDFKCEPTLDRSQERANRLSLDS